MSKKISKTEMMNGVKTMNSFGTRITGSDGQLSFIKYLKDQIKEMGLEVYSDPFYFKKWEKKEASLKIFGYNGPENIEISSVFPYSGETKDTGITSELFYVEDKIRGYAGVKDKIAVIEVSELEGLPSEIAFDKRSAYPEDVQLPENYSGPVATTFVKFTYAKIAKLRGARAIVFIWKGLNDELAKGQYLPFILEYQGIPAVWVSESQGKIVKEAAKAHRTATITLTADTVRHAYTETFYCILKGESDKESVIINTHTDGVNCVEENGPIALLQLIKTLKEKKLNRNHIFVFVTGHFRLPIFKDSEGGGVQATSKWLAMHPDLWDGKQGHLKAAAGVSIEHLGCMEFADIDGEYKATGEIQTELVYTGNNTMDDIYMEFARKRENVRTMTLRGHNFLHFGEGQPLFNSDIPESALVTAPDYLCVESENSEMDKFDINLMYEQTVMFENIIRKLDDVSSKDIGSCNDYSIVSGKSVSGKNDINVKSLGRKVMSVIKK